MIHIKKKILKNRKFFFENKEGQPGEWMGLDVELGRHSDGEMLDVKCVITDMQGCKVSTSVSSLCLSHSSLTFGASGFLLHFYFLSQNHISVFILTFVQSALVLNYVFDFTILIRCCFESIVFSVSCCKRVEGEEFAQSAFESRILPHSRY